MLWCPTMGYVRRRRLYVRNKGGQQEDRVAKFRSLEEVRQSSHWDESLADDQPLCLRGEMGVCVCCLVGGASHSQERRKLAAADCEVLDCFSQPAGYNPSRTYTTTGSPPRRTQAGRLTTAKRVCSLADPASSQPVQPAVRDPAAQSGYMTLLQRTGAPVREIRVGGWRPRGLLCCSRERVLPKTGSRLQHTKPHQTTPHTSHTTLSLRGCMDLQARRSLAMQAAVLSREEAMGGWPRH